MYGTREFCYSPCTPQGDIIINVLLHETLGWNSCSVWILGRPPVTNVIWYRYYIQCEQNTLEWNIILFININVFMLRTCYQQTLRDHHMRFMSDYICPLLDMILVTVIRFVSDVLRTHTRFAKFEEWERGQKPFANYINLLWDRSIPETNIIWIYLINNIWLAHNLDIFNNHHTLEKM